MENNWTYMVFIPLFMAINYWFQKMSKKVKCQLVLSVNEVVGYLE